MCVSERERGQAGLSEELGRGGGGCWARCVFPTWASVGISHATKQPPGPGFIINMPATFTWAFFRDTCVCVFSFCFSLPILSRLGKLDWKTKEKLLVPRTTILS